MIATRSLAIDQVRQLDPEGDGPKRFEFVASTENEVRVFDRARGEVVGEILRMSGADLDAFRRNPVVLDAHRKEGSEYVVGSAQVRVEAGQLIATITFDAAPGSAGERNQRLVEQDMLRALSIGYGVRESEVTGQNERTGEPVVNVTGWTLIEISTTPVPADPDALKRAHLEANVVTETTPAPQAPTPNPEPEPQARSVEEEQAAAFEVAAKLTQNPLLQTALVRAVQLADDPAVALEALDNQRKILHARTVDPKLRALGGQLIAEADNPLTVDVVPELRKALIEQTAPVTTPEPPPPTPAPHHPWRGAATHPDRADQH